MEEPNDGAQLQKLFCVLQWVKTGLPTFNRIAEPLPNFIEKVYVRSNTRKKPSVSRISLIDVG